MCEMLVSVCQVGVGEVKPPRFRYSYTFYFCPPLCGTSTEYKGTILWTQGEVRLWHVRNPENYPANLFSEKTTLIQLPFPYRWSPRQLFLCEQMNKWRNLTVPLVKKLLLRKNANWIKAGFSKKEDRISDLETGICFWRTQYPFSDWFNGWQ